jgi:hypothetical protein
MARARSMVLLVVGVLCASALAVAQNRQTGAKATVTASALSLPLSSSLPAWHSFDDSRSLVFLGWQDPKFNAELEAELASTWTCEFTPAQNPVNPCTLERTVDARGVKLEFTGGRTVTDDLSVVVKNGAKILITLRIDSCKFRPKGVEAGTAPRVGLSALYLGAEEVRVELDARTSCLDQLRSLRVVELVAAGGATVFARVETDGGGAEPTHTFLRTERVPSTLPVGTQELEVRVNASAFGTLRIPVQPGLAVMTDAQKPALNVEYGADPLDRWHSGKSVDGLAVVTPKSANDVRTVLNTATLTDSVLLEVGRALSAAAAPSTTDCRKLWDKRGCGWRDLETSALLDEDFPDTFCPPAKFECAPALTPGEEELKACEGVAYEAKVNVCKEKMDEGEDVFTVEQRQALDIHRDHARAWRVSSPSWGASTWFEEDWLIRKSGRQPDLASIGFVVTATQPAPLTASVELFDPASKVTLFRTNLLLASGARLESLPLPLAAALSVECGKRPAPPRPRFRFGPPPVTDRLPVTSSIDLTRDFQVRDRARNGQVKAVMDDDLDTGSCYLHYDPDAMTHLVEPTAAEREQELEEQRAQLVQDRVFKYGVEYPKELAKAGKAAHAKEQATKRTTIAAEKWANEEARRRAERRSKQRAVELTNLLRLYGKQLLEVVVTRGTEPSETKPFTIDDPAKDSFFPLPKIKERGGDYTVVAHLKGPEPLSVIYRPGPDKTQASGGSATGLSTAFEFRALLRPRGFGAVVSNHLRGFVTFPVRFTGLRFPAKSSDLAASGDRTRVQLTSVQAGVLGVLEPWNYDTRTNPLFFRIAGGFNLYDLSTGRFAPASLLGVSATLPILPLEGGPNARNLNSSLALGAFWEVDFDQAHPVADGSHFLLTFGLDLASLLSE